MYYESRSVKEWFTGGEKIERSKDTVNPEYFVCVLFSSILYAAASVRK